MRLRLIIFALLILASLAAACSAAPTAAPAPSVATEAPAAADATAPPVSAAPATTSSHYFVVSQQLLPDLGGRLINAVTENAYTPLNFVDPQTGQAVGWEYDAVNEICRRLNCQVNWNVTAWDTMISAVREGQFDVGMDGITITDERKQQVDFSDPYLLSQQFMLVRAGEDRFANAAEFAADPELLIGSQAGTTNFYTAVYEVLDGDESNPRIKLFDTFGAAVQALLNGDVDMVLMDKASSTGYISANPDKLVVIGDPLASEDFGFIFSPGSDLTASFNAAIDSMVEDGFFDHLNRKWFYLYGAQ